MKTLLLLLICITMNGQVIMYEHSNYEGASKTYNGGGKVNLLEDKNPSSFWCGFGFGCCDLCNDMISSIKVPAGFKVTIFEHKDFGGRSRVLYTDTPYLGNDWNDIITSFIIERTGPELDKPIQCNGNGNLIFNNQTSEYLWIYYWYLEDTPNVSDVCQIRKFFDRIPPREKKEMNTQKNKNIVYQIYTSDLCLLNHIKANGTLNTCTLNSYILDIF
ncbi:hypothetical protein [Chryseobacterium sp. ON_d1]|uniref:hypothetical protein n=1 Tax=Chryseobacterium sp. ON_d1 TaxID=2583211 RepID=UPI00115B816D|nr:hypothetical protein [Chryseobacterium sp. ON_d1]GEJ45319.1 hypothetical protein CRS_19270 [Chryseobacterium sp. ON_d1]